jgi:hypothetical protein
MLSNYETTLLKKGVFIAYFGPERSYVSPKRRWTSIGLHNFSLRR